jgi:hypothetical protein
VGVAVLVVAAFVAVAIYVVKSRRLAAEVIAKVSELRSSLGGSPGQPQ